LHAINISSLCQTCGSSWHGENGIAVEGALQSVHVGERVENSNVDVKRLEFLWIFTSVKIFSITNDKISIKEKKYIVLRKVVNS
jgi:hypothetical protein